MATSNPTPSIDAKAARAYQRRRFQSLDTPHGRVAFRISSTGRGRDIVHVEYRGTEIALTAAGIVAAGCFIPQPGRARSDDAGRRFWLQRRRNGMRFLSFTGDLLAHPRLPGVTDELVDEAIAERDRVWGTCKERRARAKAWAPASEPSSPVTDTAEPPVTYSRAEVDRVLNAAKRARRELELASGVVTDGMLAEQIGRCLGRLDGLIEGDWLPARERPRLRLIVDNTAPAVQP